MHTQLALEEPNTFDSNLRDLFNTYTLAWPKIGTPLTSQWRLPRSRSVQ